MPSIRCRYVNCVFLDDGYCSATKVVEIDPDEGCLTYTTSPDLIDEVDEPWDDEDELEEWDEFPLEEDEDELWLDDEEEDY